jgi:tight adherence protein B
MNILLITLIVFLAAVLVIFGLYYFAVAAKESAKSEVKRRLGVIALRSPSDEVMPSILKEQTLSEIPLLNKLLFNLAAARRTEALLDQADVKMKVGTFFLTVVVLVAFGLLAGIVLHKGMVIGLLLAVILGASPFIYLSSKKSTRFRKFTEQFPDTLDMIARSLRAGHSFTSAMLVVSQEMPDPVAKVFRIAHDEQNLGLSLSESLSNMTERINSLDLSFFVTAVNIQRETGGNLAEILEKLGITIRERFKILGQLRVYTAQGRLSGYILAVMPLVLAVIIWVINPDYLMTLVQNKIGLYMIAMAVFLQIVGLFVIKKIIKIQI